MSRFRLVLDPIACDGHGLCYDLFPEGVGRDDWGFPVLTAAEISGDEARHARRAVAACPVGALRMRRLGPDAGGAGVGTDQPRRP